ncbi:helix-turn-helix transcriptional regulator [Zemynaea arenosa]|nr:YafY family protein [Massilia arenosa]
MTRSERLLAILDYLRGRTQPVTAAQLAEHFQVSERSIYRDVSSLNRRGARIDGSAGVGYVFREGYFLPPLAFTAEEAAAILLGLRFVLRRGDAQLAEAARLARAKIAATAPATFGPGTERAVPLLVAPRRPKLSDARLQALRQAIASERVVALSYEDADGRLTERQIWPVAIGWCEEVEIVGAWCALRGAFRTFRLDRVRGLDVLDQPFPQPRQALLAAYLKHEPGIQL